MRPVGNGELASLGQSQVRLMDEGGGIQQRAAHVSGETRASDPAEILVGRVEDDPKRSFVATAGLLDQLRERQGIAHGNDPADIIHRLKPWGELLLTLDRVST